MKLSVLLLLGSVVLFLSSYSTTLYSAGSECGLNRACLLFMNLTSTVPSQSELDEIQKIIDKDGMFAAGEYITKNSKEFVNVVLRDFSDSWSDVDGNPGAVLNATSATIIAAIVHGIDFRRILYDDIVAQGKGELQQSGDSLILASNSEEIEVPFHNRNKHYEQLETLDAYHHEDALTLVSQVPLILKTKSATAGILTSRGFAKAAFEAGTNRRMYPILLREAFCLDLSDVQDPTIIEKYILRDVGKKDPDGSVTTFKAVCKTCHGAMDQLATAAIDYSFKSNSLDFKSIRPISNTNKMLKIVESTGHIPKNDEWRTELTENQLSILGIRTTDRSGFGLKSFGQMISRSEGFAKCQVQKAFRISCGKKPETKDQTFLDQQIRIFKNGYQLKKSFIQSAAYCAELEAKGE